MGAEAQIIGAVVSFAASQKAASAADMQAQAYQEQAEAAKIQSMQEEAQRRRELRQQMASLNSSMSAQSVALGSGSGLALQRDEMVMAKNDIASIQLMGKTNRRKFELSAAGSKAEASAQRLAGAASFANTMGEITT